LEPIASLSNTYEYAIYADQCINQIFPYEVFLTENKRLKTQEQKEQLKQIKSDIFNTDIPVMNTIEKYFKFTQDITNSTNNIAYMNDTCKAVAEHIRTMLNKTDDYEVGEYLICREYTKLKEGTLNANFKFEIAEVHEDKLVLRDRDIEYHVPMQRIKSSFIHAYCSTCHSFQGSSIEGKVTIFDYKFYFTSRNWIWVAITRATDLNNVFFYEYDDDELNIMLIRDYFKRKCEGYKRQDKTASRELSDPYVDAEWFMRRVKSHSCCSSCGVDFSVSISKKGVISSNITAQRLNNSICHSIANCTPMCRHCNCSIK
jgi:hypothetical protein